MAVLLSNDNKELIVTCDCGCENGFHIKVENVSDNYFAFLSYINGNFYTEQQKGFFGTLLNKLRKIWAVIVNKDYYYSDVVMSKDDFEKFAEYINQY